MKLGMSKKLMMIVGIAVLVVGGGAGAFLASKSMSGSAKKATPEKGVDKEIVEDATKKEGGEEKKEGEGEGEGEGEKKEGKGEGEVEGEGKSSAANDLMYQFEKFTVNLMDPKGPRYFLVVDIQMKAATAEARTKIEENVAPLRDATITLLTSKTREDVAPAEGKERIKRELMARYEGILSPGTIQGIYFDSFVVMTR